MTKKEALEYPLILWWWNHGKKIKDFEGTYKEWFKNNNISIKENDSCVIFKCSYGALTFSIKLSRTDLDSFNLIIKLCLTYLGDKAMMRDGYNREYKINWR